MNLERIVGMATASESETLECKSTTPGPPVITETFETSAVLMASARPGARARPVLRSTPPRAAPCQDGSGAMRAHRQQYRECARQ